MMLCLSPESIERVNVGTGSGELWRPIHLQPLGGQIGSWDWGEEALWSPYAWGSRRCWQDSGLWGRRM